MLLVINLFYELLDNKTLGAMRNLVCGMGMMMGMEGMGIRMAMGMKTVFS